MWKGLFCDVETVCRNSFTVKTAMSLHMQSSPCTTESMIEGFYTPLPPTTAISLHSDGKYALHEQDCFLPLDVPEVICGCLTSTILVGPGKHIILVGINGRYNVTVPVLTCTTCLSTWTANLADLIKNRYWPATVNCDTIYQRSEKLFWGAESVSPRNVPAGVYADFGAANWFLWQEQNDLWGHFSKKLLWVDVLPLCNWSSLRSVPPECLQCL